MLLIVALLLQNRGCSARALRDAFSRTLSCIALTSHLFRVREKSALALRVDLSFITTLAPTRLAPLLLQRRWRLQ